MTTTVQLIGFVLHVQGYAVSFQEVERAEVGLQFVGALPWQRFGLS